MTLALRSGCVTSAPLKAATSPLPGAWLVVQLASVLKSVPVFPQIRCASSGVGEGAKAILDGRNTKIPGYESGYFLTPTILDGLPSSSQLADTEIFGPVLSLVHANSIEEAMEFLRRSPYGNQASLFTTSGSAARKFRYEVPAGNIGINIGVAAPMAYFPFSGWKESFFGILHGQGRDAVEFFTESKIVIERWSRQETRKF